MQQEIFGFDSLKRLEGVIREFGAKNIFLVVDEKSFKLSGAEEKLACILKKIKYSRFDSFNENPDITDVKKGITFFKKVNLELVVAIGGGSAIDTAKAINILAAQKGQPEKYASGKTKLKQPGKPLVAIPTTAGTGSEATHYATIYINKKKYSLGDKNLTLPTVSIVDPSLTESMPKYLTASTGLDALCQGIESMWSVYSTEESRRYARESIKLAFMNIEKAVNNPNKESRYNMAKAANLSGKAINISKTTACHSISYPITAKFRINHGHAVSLTMPQFLVFNVNVEKQDCNDKRGVDFVKKQLNEIFELMNCKDAGDAKKQFQQLMQRIGIENKLSKLDISKKDIDIILEKGFTPNRMNNNPRKITKEQLKNIMEEII
jgi:alcohol dehydrogenase class IV